jgi:AcrR family transcriptional regulator
LFVREGYATTTIAAIAVQADVAVQTIYAVFGTKRAVLSELLSARVTGDDDATPLKDRTDWRAMEAETDPRRQLRLLAAIASPAMHYSLVVERRWKAADYERWLAQVLTSSLLRTSDR